MKISIENATENRTEIVKRREIEKRRENATENRNEIERRRENAKD